MRARPLTPEQAQARIAGYRGSKGTARHVIEFTREVVRDSLAVGPQPSTAVWVSYTACVVGMLAAECDRQGLAMDRSVVLDRARIDRFLSHACKHMTPQGRASYRSRLDVVACALLYGQNDPAWPRAVLGASDPLQPWDDAQAARIALWTTGVRPAARRERLRVVLGLTLGAGLRRRDLVTVTGLHVAQDARGVHVTVPPAVKPDGTSDRALSPGDAGRTVTVAAAWEQEVLLAARRAGKNLIVAPTRTSFTADAVTATIDRANLTAPAGDEVSVTRARNTWVVRHLAAGTPLPLLMAQAGLGAIESLHDLLPYVPRPDADADADAAAAWMRGV